MALIFTFPSTAKRFGIDRSNGHYEHQSHAPSSSVSPCEMATKAPSSPVSALGCMLRMQARVTTLCWSRHATDDKARWRVLGRLPPQIYRAGKGHPSSMGGRNDG